MDTNPAKPKFITRGECFYWVTFDGRTTVGSVRKDDFDPVWIATGRNGRYVGMFATRRDAALSLRPRSL